MKKSVIIAIVIGIVLILFMTILSMFLFFGGIFMMAKPLEIVSLEEFEQIMEDKDFTVISVKETQFADYDYVKDVKLAINEDYQIEFFVFDDTSDAEKSHMANVEKFESEKGNMTTNFTQNVSNGGIYKLQDKDKYKCSIYVDNILVFVDTNIEHKEEINSILDEILCKNEDDETTDDDKENKENNDKLNQLDPEEEETIANFLEKNRNWNLYSKHRMGKLGKKAEIEGGWRVLADTESYWKFEDDKFWWYKSVYDLDDNYWYGSTKIITGKKGVKMAGLNADGVEEMINMSDGKITEDDVYTIICTPTKMVQNGIDKTREKITEEVEWTYVWVVCDHGKEGIEGQMINASTAQILYYVKVED